MYAEEYLWFRNVLKLYVKLCIQTNTQTNQLDTHIAREWDTDNEKNEEHVLNANHFSVFIAQIAAQFILYTEKQQNIVVRCPGSIRQLC